MAPARRRSSGRAAAAAAAAQQQWKVGDLVLAKMKGFPAWPAMISEPEKWGLSATRKKVLVYFYGTQQIAFCNHVDIEAFTEEKKKILLNKRHGKGADFVRAVNEIITVYDKLKNKTQDELDSEKSSRASLESDSHEVECHQLEALHASTEGITVLSSEDIVAASSAEADICRKDTEKKDRIGGISMMDQLRQNLACSTAPRKRLKDASLHSCAIQGKVASQNSSDIAPCKVNESNLPRTNENRQNDGDLMVDMGQIDLPAESNCQMPNRSDCHGLSLHVSEDLVSSERNGVVESNAVASWPEAAHINKCFMPEPSQTTDQIGILKKDCASDGELTCSVEFLTFKKKRKLNPKMTSSVDNGEVLVSHAKQKQDPLKHRVCSNGTVERSESTDGDEHLPLVKRARVRMKLQSEEEYLEEIANNNVEAGEGGSAKDSSKQAIFNGRLGVCPSNAADSTVRESSSCISNSNCTPHDDVRFWKAKGYKLSGCNLDVEAALPLSKRLHRALEAMSANENANETPEQCIQRPLVVDILPNGSIDSPMPSTSIVSLDEGRKVKVRNAIVACDSHYNSSPSNDPLVASSKLILRELDMAVEKSIEGRSHTPSGKLSSTFNQPCSVFISEMSSIGCDNQPLQTSSTCAVEAQFCPSPSQDGEDRCTSAVLQPNRIVGSTKDEKVVQNTLNADVKVAPRVTDFGLPVTCEGLVSRSTLISSSEADRSAVSADMQEFVNDAKIKMTPKDSGFAIDMTPMKVLIAAAQAKRLLCRSTSFGDAATDVKVVPCTSSNPCLSDKEFNVRGLSASSMMYHRPHSDDRIHVLHNGRASPQNSSTQEKNLKKSASLDETNAARKSFEAILCTLSRTKDSIGRATRLAIECAKFGIAKEVIEILLQYLERETEMHRRVDLFFLVDSITQCSANQKGDAGDVYPSLVQPILSRLLSAVAPPGHSARENRRQCLKVLKIWLERKILPESIIRAHMKELDAFQDVLPRRLLRNERALNDPVREMEGMLVDEYGSNTSFQLPGLLSPCVLEDEEKENACQEKASKVSEPGCIYEVNLERVPTGTPTHAKHHHVLEEVDGELEMEDVAPPSEIELSSKNHTSDADGLVVTFAPPLPEDKPPSPPPLPCSPPPDFPALVPNHSPNVSHAILDATDDSQLSKANNCHPQNKHASDTIPNLAMPYYAPVCGMLAKQIPPPPPAFSSSDISNGNVPVIHQPVHSGDSIQHPVTGTPNRLGYHLQPPPLTVSNQFSYVQGEAQQRGPSWETHSSYNDFHFANDRQVGSFYSEGIHPGAMRHDLPERSGFSSSAHPGPLPSGHVETMMTLPYGPFLEPPSLPCRGWSHPPRLSNYNQQPARPPFDPMARAAGAPGYWRPR